MPVAGHAAELAVGPVAEHAAELVDGLAAEIAVGVVAAAAVPGAEQDGVLVAAGLAVELAVEQLAELVPVCAVCCSSFLVE